MRIFDFPHEEYVFNLELLTPRYSFRPYNILLFEN